MNGEASHVLSLLVRDIGEAGVAEMAGSPGLAAAVDQHVAFLRDELAGPGGTPDEGALMEYLREFAEDACGRGWWPCSTRDWEFVRIVAVCWLMRQVTGG